MDARNLLSLAGVLLVLGGTGYYWGLGRTEPRPIAPDEARHPVYELTGLAALETGTDGRISRQLDARRLQAFEQPDEAVLEAPVLHLYNGSVETWRLRADTGRGLDGNREIRLEGNVLAERLDPAAQPVRFTTPRLSAWPAEERLYTDQGVQLQTPQGTLASRTLDARQAVGTLTLTQNVTGHYAPAPR
ncbi:MAG: LPS export ABC transporter periplasmic protein LptC [Moraxellaceae bacterium]|nr:LPS export ABC transporter periplasmic protein LptC [Moraxellaceae bacterium]